MAPARRRGDGDRATFAATRRPPLATSIVWRDADATPARRVRVVPSPQMTWRGAPTSPSGDVELLRPRSAPALAPAEPFVVVGARAVTSSVEAPSAPSPVQMRELDPRVIDRLADDVIRRVERRARIERERRGV
jgi:hypothetical protein